MNPDRAEVLTWMARTGNGALRAARQFAGPTASDEDVKRLHNRIKRWNQRTQDKRARARVAKARSETEPEPEPPPPPPPMFDIPPAPDIDPSTETRVEFYARRLCDVEVWIRLAAQTGKATLLASMLRQQSDDRTKLDEAIEEESRERAHLERAKVRDAELIADGILERLPDLLAVCSPATRARFVDALKSTSWWEPEEESEDGS